MNTLPPYEAVVADTAKKMSVNYFNGHSPWIDVESEFIAELYNRDQSTVRENFSRAFNLEVDRRRGLI
jgi:hypothetical protein